MLHFFESQNYFTVALDSKYPLKYFKRNETVDYIRPFNSPNPAILPIFPPGDSGLCTSYGRWHVPSQGCGFAIASTPSAFDIYKWAYNWNALCDVEIIPVTRDEQTREVIKGGMGFQFKHNMLMEEMSEMM